ncbi:jasmonate-induced oxygenase 2-like [Andrographis paniculata]|uniref:jasmonate-induced oxygenase 2-like n=1 Tax=Andrographis paniculata TaxID=175694 RepID=UPI0021E79D95|nr:jasmonate-induced oxygenase 2-like [Andrographis paniculata]
MRRTRDTWWEFFHLPLNEKEKYANNPATVEGYGSRNGIEKGLLLDWNDYFFIYAHPPLARNFHRWPTRPPTLKWRSVTNGIYKSAEHRVTVNSDKARLSMAFFYSPFPAAVELLTADRPEMFPATPFGMYMSKALKKGPQRKDLITSHKVGNGSE